jgi:chromosome segregation ATPase
MTQSDGSSTDRRALWLAIAGAIGLVVAIVALIIAISAKNASVSDAKVTAEVKRDAGLAVAGVHAQIQRDVASANTVLHQLEAGSRAAARTRDALLRDVKQNRAGLAASNATIAKMQVEINTLGTEVKKLTATVNTLNANQQALTKKVNALSNTKP